jgi:hypothetical protein
MNDMWTNNGLQKNTQKLKNLSKPELKGHVVSRFTDVINPMMS